MASEAGLEPGGYRDPGPFSHRTIGHLLTFYPAGLDRRAALLSLIDEARVSLKLAFYIFAEDAIGHLVRDRLAAAAARGVAVTLVFDRFGSAASDRFLAPLRMAGGDCRCFNPRWSQRYLVRNHQKLIIADDARAIVGGFNIEDGYFAEPGPAAWTDLAVAIEGPAAAGLAQWFEGLREWADGARPHFRAIQKAVRRWEWSSGKLRWLVGGPTRGLSTWARQLYADMDDGERLDIVMAYFSPPWKLRRAIEQIARRGYARLILPAFTDNTTTVGASRSLYGRLLGAGAEIREFTAAQLHTKLIVLDDVVYIGSANFDVRSLYINLEIMLEIDDAALADRMRAVAAHYSEAAIRITPELHAARATWFNRLRWWLSWVLVSVVDYTVSRKLNLGL